MKYRIATLLAITVSSVLPACGSDKTQRADPVDVLRHVTHRTSYIFADRDFHCVVGKIAAIRGAAVTIRPAQGAAVTIDGSKLLRVTESVRAADVVYSARSSWSDIEAIPVSSRESVRVSTKSGKTYEAHLLKVTVESMTLLPGSKSLEIPKGDVLTVDYLREKPATDSAKHSAQELFVLNPELWPHFLRLSGIVAVRLYDSRRPEDNSPIRCANDPWQGGQERPDITKH